MKRNLFAFALLVTLATNLSAQTFNRREFFAGQYWQKTCQQTRLSFFTFAVIQWT